MSDTDRLIASVVANSGRTLQDIADELEMTVEEVRAAALRGSKLRTWND